jgi:hypothetical protein
MSQQVFAEVSLWSAHFPLPAKLKKEKQSHAKTPRRKDSQSTIPSYPLRLLQLCAFA